MCIDHKINDYESYLIILTPQYFSALCYPTLDMYFLSLNRLHAKNIHNN